MEPERDRVVRAIEEIERAVRLAHRADKSLETQELERAVLERLGMEPEMYRRAIEADPELVQLEEAALREAVAGVPDPGPYDSISREASSGQPGDLSTTARQNVRPRE